MKICKTCQFWDNGNCEKFDHWEYNFDDNKLLESGARMETYTHDDSGLTYRFRTSPKFGCNEHKDK